MNEKDKIAELLAVLETLKHAGWITGYTLMTDPWVVDWTDHGRERARQFLSLADELDLNADLWVFLEAICKLLPPLPADEFIDQSRN